MPRWGLLARRSSMRAGPPAGIGQARRSGICGRAHGSACPRRACARATEHIVTAKWMFDGVLHIAPVGLERLDGVVPLFLETERPVEIFHVVPDALERTFHGVIPLQALGIEPACASYEFGPRHTEQIPVFGEMLWIAYRLVFHERGEFLHLAVELLHRHESAYARQRQHVCPQRSHAAAGGERGDLERDERDGERLHHVDDLVRVIAYPLEYVRQRTHDAHERFACALALAA